MAQTADTLFSLADEHGGVFTAGEASRAGISRQHLVMLEKRGRLKRLSRGIYQLLNYPVREDHVQLWEAVLWPTLNRPYEPVWGIVSHLSALRLNYSPLAYEPATVDITVPRALRLRRHGRPKWLNLHVGEVDERDVSSIDGIPVTTLERTLSDCIAAGVDRRLILQVLDAAGAEPTLERVLSDDTVARFRKALRA